MSDLARIRRRRTAQKQAVAFFAATDEVIQFSKGTDAISQTAAKEFVLAVQPMFLKDHNIDLKTKPIEDGTYLLFSYLESQTLNDYIDPTMALFYGQALAMSLIKLGLHSEKLAHDGTFVIRRLSGY